MKLIVQDKREINTLFFPGQTESHFKVGQGKITKIQPYYEEYELWFAIYDKNNEIISRWNGKHVEGIFYLNKNPEKQI